MPTPNITRRAALTGTAAGAAAIVAGTGTALAAERTATENLALLALAPELDETERVFIEADRVKAEARAHYEAIAPAVPEDIVCKGHVGQGLAKQEVDCEGTLVWSADRNAPPRYIMQAAQIEKHHGQCFGDRRHHAREMKRLHQLAVQYEADIKAAREASDIEQAIWDREIALWGMVRIANAIAKEPALTAGGLLLKARAFFANAECDPKEKWQAHNVFAPRLAQDIVAVLGGTAGGAA